MIVPQTVSKMTTLVSQIVDRPRPFLPPAKKGQHTLLARLHQFCRNLLRASLADHLHVGHAQIADRLFT
jgi:hypothetical protein